MTGHRDFPCRVDSVTDGDTLIVTIDAGFRVHIQSKVRLAGIDCPEMSTPEGKLARDFVVVWTGTRHHPDVKWPLLLRCYGYDRRDKYGRWLADLLVPSSDRDLPEPSLVIALAGAGYIKVAPNA